MIGEEAEEKDFLYEQVIKIMTAMNQDQQYTMLNETDLILNIIPPSFKEAYDFLELGKEVRGILNNKDKLKHLKLIQRIKAETETGIEYYSQDLGDDERLLYGEDFENTMMTLQQKIRDALGKIMKKLLVEDTEYD